MVARFALQKASNSCSYSHLFSQGDTDAHTALCNNCCNDISPIQHLKCGVIRLKRKKKEKKKQSSKTNNLTPVVCNSCVVCECMWVFAFVSGVCLYLWAKKRRGKKRGKGNKKGRQCGRREMGSCMWVRHTFYSSHLQLSFCLIFISPSMVE